MQTVLFVIRATGFGGLEILLLDWLTDIDYSTTKVVVASHQVDRFSQEASRRRLPAKFVSLPSPDRGRLWKVVPKWISLFSSIRPDRIVLLEGAVPDFDLAPFFMGYCATKGNLYVYESTAPDPTEKTKRKLHFGFLPGLGLWWHKAQWNIRARGYVARKTLAISQGTKDKLIAYYRYPSKNTTVVHHGVDTQRFYPSQTIRTEFRRLHGIPDNATVVVSHGRLARNKRVDRIIRAFEILSAERKNIWLILSAHGPLREEVTHSVAQLKESHRVKLMDFEEDISRLVQASDIYVLASNSEGFGIALAEAMAAGLVCVSTNISGPRDFVVDGQNGLLVEESDEGIMNGLRRAIELEESQKEVMSRQARTTIVNNFDLRRVTRGALEALQISSLPSSERPAIDSLSSSSCLSA